MTGRKGGETETWTALGASGRFTTAAGYLTSELQSGLWERKFLAWMGLFGLFFILDSSHNITTEQLYSLTGARSAWELLPDNSFAESPATNSSSCGNSRQERAERQKEKRNKKTDPSSFKRQKIFRAHTTEDFQHTTLLTRHTISTSYSHDSSHDTHPHTAKPFNSNLRPAYIYCQDKTV